MIYPAESVFVFVFSLVFFSLCFGFIQWKPFFFFKTTQQCVLQNAFTTVASFQLAAS